MKSSLAAVLLCACTLSAADFRLALPGHRYEFPRDHFNHPDYKTEWWYYTGNLEDTSGRRFGFELTFFRQGVQRPAKTDEVWSVSDAWLAHFALSDIAGRRFFHTERLNRAGPGLAGADEKTERIWNGNWSVTGFRRQELHALAADFAVHLKLNAVKPPVAHGVDGVSQKAAGVGRASHYVSLPRLAAEGTVEVEGKKYAVRGQAWMDHEFFTHQLTAEQSGWDWLSLQLDDSTELMLFRIRHRDGSVDPYSAGTVIDARGNSRHLTREDFSLTPGRTWTSPRTGARYPVEWKIRVPSLDLELDLTTPLDSQELAGVSASSPVYWEGAIDLIGRRGAKPVRGRGYLEMTGYAGAVDLSR